VTAPRAVAGTMCACIMIQCSQQITRTLSWMGDSPAWCETTFASRQSRGAVAVACTLLVQQGFHRAYNAEQVHIVAVRVRGLQRDVQRAECIAPKRAVVHRVDAVPEATDAAARARDGANKRASHVSNM
jgi:hypothetical protein